MDIVEELYKVAGALETSEVNYAVCGGLAVAIHGRPRTTIDIDLVIPAASIEQAVKSVAVVGFDIDSGWVPLPASDLGIARLYRLTKIEGSQFLTLDLLEADSATNPIFLAREIVSVGERRLTVLSKTALIQMKSRSTRTKDKLDIEMLQDEAN